MTLAGLPWLVRPFAQSSARSGEGTRRGEPLVPHLLSVVVSAGCWLHSEVTSAPIPVSVGDWLALVLQSQSGTSDVTWARLAADTMDGDSAWLCCSALPQHRTSSSYL